MRVALFLLAFIISGLSLNATTENAWAEKFSHLPQIEALTPEMVQLGLEDFLALTPKKYQEITGEKLGLKKTLQLKAAQKTLKKAMHKDPDIEKGLYVLLAILGLGWVAMGVMDDWKGNDWVVNLILCVLCWLPGVIHALVKMKKYY